LGQGGLKKDYRRILTCVLAVLTITTCLIVQRNKEFIVRTVTSDNVITGQEELKLYARSAVLMDADSGRILYAKNPDDVLAMASTTKIMTLIIALENEKENDIATVSSYAASQPKVHLGMRTGEQFYLNDLYYSLMLESHNDTAVCIAEHIGRQFSGENNNEYNDKANSRRFVEIFLDKMNEKAQKLGLEHTYFLTPNGLDNQRRLDNGDIKEHQTTAAELASILKYCINDSPSRERFLEITGKDTYSFTDVDEKRSFYCSNHNAFLHMMDGAFTGKTGFTSKAGYCYVGALRQKEKTFIVSLLACGWPNNKNYKWSDATDLMNYGLENYEYQNVYPEHIKLPKISILNGIPDHKMLPIEVKANNTEKELRVLLHKNEKVSIEYKIKKQVQAPVKKGDTVGAVYYKVNDYLLAEYPVISGMDIEEMNLLWCFKEVIGKYVPRFQK